MTSASTLLAPVGRHGVVTLSGYGIKVSVDRGHLVFEDGIGSDRRSGRFSRVRHGLRRLVVIGSDGLVSLAALRWLADQNASFVMLDREGSVLATTGPVRPSDARLRRAQALAHESGVALEITRELISRKLEAQEKLAREELKDSATAQLIARARDVVTAAETIEGIRLSESRGAYAYWGGWRNLRVSFPKNELNRVPSHWRVFGTRVSPLTGSPRLAVNPVNAILNYLYAVLESETRLAVAALGLDPGLGVLHADAPRDSLACDVMEPIRPIVDGYVLGWIIRETLRRDWFLEERNGNCRLMASLAVKLSETASIWGRAVGPVAERVARLLWATASKQPRRDGPPTRLTQLHRREVKGALPIPVHPGLAGRESFCRECGVEIGRGRSRCASCSSALNTAGLIKAAEIGRIAGQSEQAQISRANTQRKHATARAAWRPCDLPKWLSEEVYRVAIQPRLKGVSLSVLASALGISIPYAVDVRKGRRMPHARHWQTLAHLVSVTECRATSRPPGEQ